MKFPGSDINNFKRVVGLASELLDKVGDNRFLSAYSIIPVISQMINLESPMMGSGASPYSIISFIFQLKDEKLFKKELALSIAEKREIIDELYDMIVPFLLEEEDKYIELLVNIKYREFFKGQDTKIKKFKAIMREKFSLLSPLFSRLHNKDSGDFAHLSHYGFLDDLYREQSFLRVLSREAANEWFKYSYPIVTELSIKGFKRKNEVRGWVIFIANSTEQLLRDEKLRKDKILQAAQLAERLGAKIVGMAGLIASFGKGGFFLTENIKNVGFTTGHAFTLGAIIQTAKKCVEETHLDINGATVAIVGAGGSIGSGCAKILAEEGVKQLILIDTSSLVASGRLENLQGIVKKINPAINLILSFEVSDIKKADIIIIATSSLKPIVKAEYLKPGAIIIDDSFPKNVAKKILQERDDIILLEAVVQLPLSLDINAARNMPDLMDVSLVRLLTCKEIYGCFAETLTLALLNHRGNYGLGQSDPTLAKNIMQKASMFDFSIAPLQSFGQAISKERFADKFSQIHANSHLNSQTEQIQISNATVQQIFHEAYTIRAFYVDGHLIHLGFL